MITSRELDKINDLNFEIDLLEGYMRVRESKYYETGVSIANTSADNDSAAEYDDMNLFKKKFVKIYDHINDQFKMKCLQTLSERKAELAKYVSEES